MDNKVPASASTATAALPKPLGGDAAIRLDTSLSRSESRPARLFVEDPNAPRDTTITLAFLVLAVAAYVVARFWRLTSFGLFGDEVFSFWVADQALPGLIDSVRGDVVHPPLFYLALKCWIAIGGRSILWLKLLPVVFSLAGIPVLVCLCRELRMRTAAISLTFGLMALNAFLVSYAQELRMYSLLMTLSITSLWLFARLINSDAGVARNQLWLAGVNLFLVFTHYYGWIIVALELGFLVIWKRARARAFAIGVAAIALAFSPWIYAVAREAKEKPARVNFVWNAPPRPSDFAGYYANLNGALSYRWKVVGTSLVMILFATPIIVWGARSLRSSRTQTGQRASPPIAFWWLMVFAVGPPVISFCASYVLTQSVWAPRYLIVAAPAYFVLVAASVFELPSKRFSIAIGSILLAWAVLSGSTDLIDRDRIAWEPLVAEMLHQEPVTNAGINVYSTDPNLGNTIQFYLGRQSRQRCDAVYVESLRGLPGDHFWVAHIRYKHELGPSPQQILSESGYEVGAGFEAEAPNHKGFLFPVWKRSGER
ncbi:MAG TPA: hypothetical protein VNS63_02915 [Blastocatellia bacterium]|nr:hypothetical protein [Blastocatellia bacterium]